MLLMRTTIARKQQSEKNRMKGVLKHIGVAVLLVLLAQTGYGQRKVLAMPDDGGVWVRWTEPNLKSKNGINIYRQEAGAGEWKLLNEKPFTYGQADMSAAIAQNAGLKRAKELADGMRDKDKLEGIGLALVLTNAVESREFSNYLGIIYQDKTAQPGKEYSYEVREVSGASETTYGQSPLVKAGKLQRGPAPTELKTKEGDGKLFFSWNSDQTRLTGAHIYYKVGGGNWQRFNKKIILPSKVPQKGGEDKFAEWLYFADSLQNGTTYTCMIKGVDFFGFETEPSSEVKLTPVDKTPPAQVSKFELQVAVDKVTATWELPNAKGVEGFNIYRLQGSDSVFTKLNKQPLAVSLRKYEETVEEVGVAYTYAIGTLDKAGNENRTEGRSIQVFDIKPPVAVRNLKAVADTGVIKLTWFPNPEKDLRGYLVYRMAKTATKGDTILVTPAALTANGYNDTLPKVAKNQFVYFVKAIDTSYNQSAMSVPAMAILPDPEPPQTPTVKSIRKEAESLRIVWLPGMESDLAGYIVYRSTKETGADSIWKPLMERALGAKDTAYADRNIEAGVSYFYRVQALDNAGNRSEKSEAFMGSVTTMRVKAMPQDIEIKHGKGKPDATITWTLPKSDDVIGCMVYRKEGKDQFLPVSGLVKEYKVTDTGLKKGSTYYYEIRAFDKVGNFAKSAPVTLSIEAE
jgi:fibronectin type 3 domain-containing protein